ncbi:hypothetical protein [Arthrobacter silvisoli]|uniref:hypothetical protein n=1 Tax=Arthrobacter silvisoli TaxID=2291022 RepID=UPI003CCC5F09
MDAEARDGENAEGSPEGAHAGKSGQHRKPAKRRKPSPEGVLPKVASEDEPRSWGDDGGYDHDAWLKEQRPPHWG